MNISTVNELIQSLESAGELSIKETKVMALAKAFKQLAAENMALKLKGREFLNEASKVYQKYNATIDFYSGDFMDGQTLHEFQFVLDAETPATDAYLAGIKADAITASLDACSDYLETDCVMDRLDISYEEAEKRTSGAMEFHDSIVAIAQQLREGAK
ncbi:hypothetical protein ACTZPA_07985 [Klebsiella pneumoniae]|uniref:hypothetical protein n=1 Tax=Klebsiella pneumoniae TaxID=573 RepID=UPI00167F49E7|nr:hypothetical protein [Klebsiella pneumoniae]MBD1268159.1 hypothetical protein [Klebsiella pneumoniae]MCP3116061.1 hypothetical protein [Klebsiella pneumoniae]MDO0718103.1 hypothetical protein [Klebsiella pneumoniae]MDO3480830.1 hypothetical protein [Klebsiella pneumoniae]MDO3492090.1 hypothetical protein [Klebsiella pneumoniae]